MGTMTKQALGTDTRPKMRRTTVIDGHPFELRLRQDYAQDSLGRTQSHDVLLSQHDDLMEAIKGWEGRQTTPAHVTVYIRDMDTGIDYEDLPEAYAAVGR